MTRLSIRSVLQSLVVLAVLAAPIAPALAANPPASFADLAEKLLPSVVNISTTQSVAVGADPLEQFQFDIPDGSPFQNFFEEFKERHGRMMPPDGEGNGDDGMIGKQKTTSLGSGFIIDPSGYIVTNYHVIQDAEEINVILQDDTNLTAKVVGRDKKTDLAVLKVESPKPLPAVVFGDSDKLRVGDWILTIGNPFGLGGSVTTGIISARARDINSGPYDDFLQTDAPINRGNSGGPMFNMDGELVGINTAIYSPSGGSVGIGFAIPSSMAKGVIEQLKTTGVTKRGWLGVRIQAVTPEIATSLGLDKARGALVSSVTPDGPADKAKLKTGDVIVAFDGKGVAEMHKLPRIVADTPVDKTADVTVIRKGKEMSFKVKVGQLSQDEDEEADKPSETKKDKKDPLQKTKTDKIDELGISVTPLTKELITKNKLAKDTKGLFIMSVSPSGLAAENGIRSGDVISEAAQQELSSAQDLIDQVQKAQKEGKPLLMLVDRKGDLRFIAVNIEKKK